MKFRKLASVAFASIITLTAVSFATAPPAFAVGTTYYVNNASGSGCTDSGAGSITTPWCTFTPANALTFGAGDQLRLASGDSWNQQLTLHGSGTASNHASLSSYGSGALPKILRNGSGTDMAIDAENPSYFDYSNLELGNAGVGLRVFLTTLGHAGLTFTNISVHDNTGFAYSAANAQCQSTNRTFLPAGIAITGDLPAFSSSDYALDGVTFDGIVGTRNVDSVSLEMCNGIASTVSGLGWQYTGTALTTDGGDGHTLIRDVVMRNLNFSGDNGPGTNSCPDALRINDTENLLLIDSKLNNETCATSSGTAAVILQRTHNIRFVNNSLTNMPNTGSSDQTAVDLEMHNTNDQFDHNYIASNAGPGLEFLGIHGSDDQDSGHVVTSNLFAHNGTATPSFTGSVISGGTSLVPSATVQGNLFDEPSGGLLGVVGGASGSGISASQNTDVSSETNAAASFSSAQGTANWSYEYSSNNGSTWSALTWNATMNRWDNGTAALFISQFDQLPSPCSSCLVSRTWTAPATGFVSIRGDAIATQSGGDGTTVGVLLNQSLLTPTSTVTSFAEALVSLDARSVVAGDKIRFVVGSGAASNNNYDVTSFDPSLGFTQASALGDTSFETPTLSHSSYSYAPAGSPWTFGTQAGISSVGSAFGNTASDGTQAAFVQGSPSTACFSQNVTGLTVGTSYSFTINASQRGSFGGESFLVTLGGASLGTFTPASTSFADIVTGSASATSTTEALSVCGATSGDHTAFIDNVRQNQPIISDPGFESPSLSSYSYGPITGSSWIFGTQTGIERNGDAFAAASAPQGVQAAFIQNDSGQGCIQRAASGWTAGSHSVSMQIAARGGGYGGQTLQVFLDSSSLGSVTPSSTGWTSYTSGTVSLTAGTHLIKICGTVAGDHTAFVDAVQGN